jgi:hypothetical protein
MTSTYTASVLERTRALMVLVPYPFPDKRNLPALRMRCIREHCISSARR